MPKLSTVLQMALGDTMCLPERQPHNLEHVLALCVSVDSIIDGTERRTCSELITSAALLDYIDIFS